MALDVGLINDIHLGFPDSDAVEPVLDELRDAVATLNDREVDLVVGMGDFIEHTDRAIDVDRLQQLAGVFDRLEAPFYAIPGNHDIVNMQAGEVTDRLDAANTDAYCSVELQERKLVFLDTTHQDDDLHPIAGFLGSEQRDWLAERIDEAVPTLLFSHHLLHYRQLTGNFYFSDKPELAIAVDKRAVTKMLASNVRAVFSAHIHETGIERFHDVPHVTMGGMDKNEDTPYTATPGIVRIDTDRLALNRGGKRFDTQLPPIDDGT